MQGSSNNYNISSLGYFPINNQEPRENRGERQREKKNELLKRDGVKWVESELCEGDWFHQYWVVKPRRT